MCVVIPFVQKKRDYCENAVKNSCEHIFSGDFFYVSCILKQQKKKKVFYINIVSYVPLYSHNSALQIKQKTSFKKKCVFEMPPGKRLLSHGSF